MTRMRSMLVLTAVAVIASTYSLRADVRTDEKARVEFAGMLGRIPRPQHDIGSDGEN